VPLEDETPARSMTFPPRFAQFPLSVFRLQLMVSHPCTFNITIVKTWNLNLQLIRRERALTPILNHQKGN
jgi:hypothetical protein